MTRRSVTRPEELLAFNTPAAVLSWCRWWDRQRGVGKELLVDRIRSGELPPQDPKSMLDRQRGYGEEIARWLAEKMPDVCKVSSQVVDWDRRCYGDVSAESLARSTSPHPAAIAAVIRLHHQHGKGSLTVGQHGPEIRAAVKAANEEAIEDYEAILAKRQQADTQPQEVSR